MLTWIKRKIDQWKCLRAYNKRIEELHKRDPFIYK
jgi:hypothetical protein